MDVLSWPAVWTAGVILTMIVVLVRETIRPDLALLGTLCLLLLGGAVTPEEAFRGFASPALVTIAALFIVAAAVQKTGALAGVDRLLLAQGGSLSRKTFQLVSVTAGMSAVVNNTPIVAILIPRVQRWAEEQGIAPSKVLIPLSYAAVLGGMMTLIGTSTNLVVSGLLREATGRGFSMFDLTWVGLPAACVGVAYLTIVCHRLLPSRESSVHPTFQPEAYHAAFRVPRGVEVPLRRFKETSLPLPSRVQRASGETFLPTDDAVFGPGDVVSFVGTPQSVRAVQQQFGLENVLRFERPSGSLPSPELASSDSRSRSGEPALFEVVVSGASALLGRPLRETDLAERFQAHILGIQRRDAEVSGRLEDAVLQAGDLLLVEAPLHFYERWTLNREEFYLVAPATGTPATPSRQHLAPWVLGIFLAMIGGATVGGLPLVTTALTAALAMVAVGALQPIEAQRSVDVPVLLMIGASFGISAALETSGLAAALAHGVVHVTHAAGPVGALVVLYLVTTVMTELLTNSAAAALAVPVALEIAASVGGDPLPYAVAVAIAASAGFATPFGYQTNLMVMSPGGYRFADYVRAGLPLNGIVMAVALLVIWMVWM